MAEKNNTLLFVALGIGGYLWWKNAQTPTPVVLAPGGTAALPSATPMPAYLGGGTVSNLAQGAAGAPPVTAPTGPAPIINPITVSTVPAAGNVPIIAPVAQPLQQPVMPFGLPPGSGKPLTSGGEITVALANGTMSAPVVNDNLMMMEMNGDYPGASHPATMSGVYC
jgi:hypothetical protein